MVSDRLAWGVRALVCVLAVAATTAQLIDFGVYGQRVRLLNMMTHRSIFGIVSLGVLAIAVGTCLVLRRRPFVVLGAILAFLFLLRIVQPPHVLVLSLPASAAALVLLWRAPLPRLVREGCVVLVAAFVVHGFGEWLVAQLGYGPETWAYQIKAVVKHSGELAGWTLVAAGLVLALPWRASGLAARLMIRSRRRARRRPTACAGLPRRPA